MAKYKNPIEWGNPFAIGAENPIDSRMVVEKEEDLYKSETWTNNGVSTPVYDGMAVTVLDKKCIYILLDQDDYQNPASWTNVCGHGESGCGCGAQGSQGKPGCCLCIDGIEDADTGELLLSGGCIDDVIYDLALRIKDLEDRLSNAITEVEADVNSREDITISYGDNPNGGKIAYIKLNGLSNY